MKSRLITKFKGHKGSIYCIESGDDNHFFTAGSEGIIAEWHLDEPEEGKLMARVPGVVYTMMRLQENLLLAGTAHGHVQVIDIAERKEIRLLQYHSSPVFRLAWWPGKNLLFSLAGDGTIQVYDAALNPVYAMRPVSGKLRSIAFSETNFYIGSPDGMILQFSDSFECIGSYAAHEPGFGVNALWLHQGLLYSGSRDARIIISDPVTGKLLQTVPAHNYAIYAIKPVPGKENIIATASRDKTVKLWNTDTLEPLQRLDATLDGHSNSVNDLVWLNEKTLVTTGDDRIAIAWEITV